MIDNDEDYQSILNLICPFTTVQKVIIIINFLSVMQNHQRSIPMSCHVYP